VNEQASAASWHREEAGFLTFARNVVTRYAAIVINAFISLLVLPINVHYLGSSAYGLWMLTASVTTYFSVLELGYGGAIVKFVAEYRAKKDVRALNEILSTLFYLLSGIGIIAYGIAAVVAALLPYIFNLEPDQVSTGRIILLLIAVNVALHFSFSIYGGVINGFQRYYLNTVPGTVAAIVTAIVNVAVLWMGYGLIELVAATTAVRVAPYWLYRRNAYKVFPALEIRRSFFRRDRLRELTGFSIYLAIIDWSTRLNFTIDTFLIGIFLNTTAVGIYSIGQRLSEALVRLTNQLHIFLFPAVVDRAVSGRADEQQQLMVRATRFQLAMAIAVCGAIATLSDTLIAAWIGPGWESSVVITQLLTYVVVLRAWMAMPSTLLKGIGRHKFVAAASAWCALANVLLSIVLVKTVGLVGVALGTVIPVTVLGAFAIFPAACRAVDLPVRAGYARVVWPTVWPAAIAIAALVATRDLVPLRLIAVVMHIAAGGLLYTALFFVLGLERDERRWFIAKLNELKRHAQPLPASSFTLQASNTPKPRAQSPEPRAGAIG
jgi:O-antigen/teichoic acid export membrane protein